MTNQVSYTTIHRRLRKSIDREIWNLEYGGWYSEPVRNITPVEVIHHKMCLLYGMRRWLAHPNSLLPQTSEIESHLRQLSESLWAQEDVYDPSLAYGLESLKAVLFFPMFEKMANTQVLGNARSYVRHEIKLQKENEQTQKLRSYGRQERYLSGYVTAAPLSAVAGDLKITCRRNTESSFLVQLFDKRTMLFPIMYGAVSIVGEKAIVYSKYWQTPVSRVTQKADETPTDDVSSYNRLLLWLVHIALSRKMPGSEFEIVIDDNASKPHLLTGSESAAIDMLVKIYMSIYVRPQFQVIVDVEPDES